MKTWHWRILKSNCNATHLTIYFFAVNKFYTKRARDLVQKLVFGDTKCSKHLLGANQELGKVLATKQCVEYRHLSFDITISGDRCIANVWNMQIVTMENVHGSWRHSGDDASQRLLSQSIGKSLEEAIWSGVTCGQCRYKATTW